MSPGGIPQHDGGGGTRYTRDGVLTVSGGEGSTVVDAAEIRTLAVRLGWTIDTLFAAASSLDAAASIVRASAHLSPATAGVATGAIASAVGELRAVLDECAALRGALEVAAGAYEAAEAGASPVHELPWLEVAFPATPFAPLLASLFSDGVTGRGLPSARSADLVARFLGLPALTRTTQTLGALGASPFGWLLAQGSAAEVTAEHRADATPARAGAVGLAEGVAHTERAPAPGAAAVEVQRVEHAGGDVSWVVSIPGMADQGAWGSDPRDWHTNLQGFFGAPTAMESLVVASLVRAGVQQGQRVLLAGHSQGGITAMRLANDPAVRQRFSIASVVTFGSPVSHIPAPRGVQVLQVEHEEDLVPGADGTRPPETAERTLVVRSLEDSSAAVDQQRWFDGVHAVGSVYTETARYIDSSSDESIVAWREEAQRLWAQPGDTVTTTIYEGERRY